MGELRECPMCGVLPDYYPGQRLVAHPIGDAPCALAGWTGELVKWNTRSQDSAARDVALEEAARVAETRFSTSENRRAGEMIAAAVRALKSTNPPAAGNWVAEVFKPLPPDEATILRDMIGDGTEDPDDAQ